MDEEESYADGSLYMVSDRPVVFFRSGVHFFASLVSTCFPIQFLTYFTNIYRVCVRTSVVLLIQWVKVVGEVLWVADTVFFIRSVRSHWRRRRSLGGVILVA